MMDPRDKKILAEQREKWELLMRDSDRLRRVHGPVIVDAIENPFCVEKRQMDFPLHRNTSVQNTSQFKSINLNGNEYYRLSKMVHDTVAGNWGETQHMVSKKNTNGGGAASFGHRKNTLTKFTHPSAIDQPQSPTGPNRIKNLPHPGVLDCDDDTQVFTPRASMALGRPSKIQEIASSPIRNPMHDVEWNESFHKTSSNHNKRQVSKLNAASIYSRVEDESMSSYQQRLNRRAAGHVDTGFCSDKHNTSYGLGSPTPDFDLYGNTSVGRSYLSGSRTIHTTTPRKSNRRKPIVAS